MQQRHLKEMNRLSLQSAELKASLEQVKCSLATAKAKQTKTAETLADYTSQWRAAQHQLAQQQAESRQLQLTNDSLSSSLSQVTVSLKAIQAEHHNCTEALKACTDNKEVAENQVQQQQNHIACMDSNLVEARKGLQHLGTQVEQQAEALTARKAALKLADQQVVRLEAQQAQHAQALAKSTADKETAQMQLRQETSARLEVQQQLDALLQAQQQQLVQTSSRQTGDSEAQTEASSTEELAALTATAEAHRKMQQWMCDLFRLKSQKKANRLHLRSANTALKRHSAGTATARQKTCEELEVVKTFAEQEGEKLHVDCCQLKVSLWLLVEGSNITAQPADVFSQQDDIGPAGSVGEDCKLLQQSPDVAAAISSASNFAAVSNTDAVPVSDTAAATHVRQPDAEVSTDMSAAERKRHKNRRRQERRTARGQVASTDVAVRANIAAQGADLRLLSADQSASPSPQAETAGPQQPMQLSTDVTQDGYDMTAGQHESVRQLDSSGPDGMASMQSKLNLDVLKAEVPPVHVADQSTQQQLEVPAHKTNYVSLALSIKCSTCTHAAFDDSGHF